MKSLVIVMIIVAATTATEKSTPKQDKRQIPSYSSGGVIQPSQSLQPTPSSVVINGSPAAYQPNYLPTCVVQPSVYPSVPMYQPPYYVPSESYVPQNQPPQYPATYQPPQYYPAAYQPSQYYPAAYQPSQYYPGTYQPPQYYPGPYQPSKSQTGYQPLPYPAEPYSYSYFTASSANNAAATTNNNNNNNVPLQSTNK